MINVALVGFGYWGPNLARVFSLNEHTQLVGCFDIDEKKIEKIKAIYPHIKVTRNYNELLSDSDLDAVIIATPTQYHYDLAKQALDAGKHVLIEKPMAKTSKECEELVRLAKEKGLTLMVDHTFEYNPSIRKIKDIIASGEIGDIYYIKANWLNLGLFQPHVNVVFDLATHIFSIVNYITGESPTSIRAVGETYIRKEMEEVASLIVKYPRNVSVYVNVSWLEPCKQRTLTIVGTKKMLVFNLLDPTEQIKIYDKGVDMDVAENKVSYRTGDIYSPRVLYVEPLKVCAQHFAESILNKTTPLTDGESGHRVVKLLEASARSLQSNGAEVLL